MPTRDPRVDAYIAKSAEYARPILNHVREVVHAACPEVEETIKWSRPHFMYKGMLCHMSAFKEHCALVFWKEKLVFEHADASDADGESLGRITRIGDLPSKTVLKGYIKKAMELNDAGIAAPARVKDKAPRELVVPEALATALKGSAKARAVFDKFSPSQKREYVDWIVEAKTEATRSKRLATALEWIAEGKTRNWKYQNC